MSQDLPENVGPSIGCEHRPTMVGRQAIFDRDLEVYAYELLYRSAAEDCEAQFADGDRATAQVMASTFVELGIDVVTGGKPAFINLTRGTISDQMVHLFPADRIIAEILEDVEADEHILDRVKSLKEAGYTIVLDDFLFHDGVAELVALADIVKLDIRVMTQDEILEHIALIRTHGAKLLAEKVETYEEYQFCRDAGFDYFQGYFLCKPQIVSGRSDYRGHVGLIELIAKINDPNSTVDELEQVITQDARLSYKLIKYINSAAFALSVKVESIHHALMLLGRRMVSVWANLVVMSGFNGKPSELLTTALMRGHMSQQVAKSLGYNNHDIHFTAGLFSVLDALLDEPMEEIISRLPLDEALSRALTNRSGEIGQILDLVIRYERGDWESLETDFASAEVLKASYFDALRWVARLLEI